MAKFSLKRFNSEFQEDRSAGAGPSQPRHRRKKQNANATTTPIPQSQPQSISSPLYRLFELESDDSGGVDAEDVGGEAQPEEVEAAVDSKDRNEMHRNEKSGKNLPITVTITDLDVFDCPICFENLKSHVYQCANGHIACDSCSVNVEKKCPTCSWPIEYRNRAIEKVLESVQVSCVNSAFGCIQVMKYCDIRDHEYMCLHTPCYCPIRDCDFVGTDSNLYHHFAERHTAISFRFRFAFSVPLQKGKRFFVLRERRFGTVFVLKLFSVHQGSAVSVVHIAPRSCTGKYRYELAGKDGEIPVGLQSPVESVPKLSDYRPTRYFLVVEDVLISHMEFCIRIRQIE